MTAIRKKKNLDYGKLQKNNLVLSTNKPQTERQTDRGREEERQRSYGSSTEASPSTAGRQWAVEKFHP